MQHKLLHDNAGQRTFVIVLDTGDEVMNRLQSFVADQHIFAAQSLLSAHLATLS